MKPRSFRKSKQLYNLLINFFRKLVLYVGVKKLSILVKFVPKYFSELLSMFIRKNVNSYYHPFSNLLIDENSTKSPFTITNLIFTSGLKKVSADYKGPDAELIPK